MAGLVLRLGQLALEHLELAAPSLGAVARRRGLVAGPLQPGADPVVRGAGGEQPALEAPRGAATSR